MLPLIRIELLPNGAYGTANDLHHTQISLHYPNAPYLHHTSTVQALYINPTYTLQAPYWSVQFEAYVIFFKSVLLFLKMMLYALMFWKICPYISNILKEGFSCFEIAVVRTHYIFLENTVLCCLYKLYWVTVLLYRTTIHYAVPVCNSLWQSTRQ